ncbi:MAG: hypothetical protein ACI3ZO_09585 [Candidatus Cryptobacteroides sp.]|nr:hypothetical protein [Bacteroidales bacterium]
MKHRILALALALLSMTVLPSEAGAFRPMKPFKFDISVHVGAGDVPIACDKIDSGYDFFGNPSVADLYEDNVMLDSFSGAYSLRLETHPLSWLSYGAEVYYHRQSGDSYNSLTGKAGGRVHFDAVYVLPEVRFYYFRTQFTTLSGALSAGLGIYSGYPDNFAFDWQIVPLTYTIGKKVYGLAEISLGSAFVGVNFGAGIRF